MPSTIVFSYFSMFFIFPNFLFAKKELSIFDRIAQGYECDPNCWFREYQIYSKTIDKWPVNCTEVCGIMRFTENADIPVFELQHYFKNLKVIKGFITVYNTPYASIEFLSSLEEVHCDILDIFSFAFNPNLEVLNFGNLTNITCNFYAHNNKVLDATDFCAKYEDLTIMYVNDNYKNCEGCVAGQLLSNEIHRFRGCTKIIGPIWLTYFYTDRVPSIDLTPFNDVQNLSGSLDLRGTDLHNLSFLTSLENIKSNMYLSYDINIEQCYNLTRFNLPSLKTISTSREHFMMKVVQVHDDFCFTTVEMHFFLESNVTFGPLEAKYCQNDTDDSACTFDNLSSLESNCTDILGKVIVNSGDEVYVVKLKSVKNIYGSLTIQNTSLTDLSFLGNLEYVAILNDTSVAFQINSNKLLQNASLPSLKRVFSTDRRYQIGFQNNGIGILNSSACLDLMDKLFSTRVVFDGKECEAIDRTKDNTKQNTANRLSIFLIVFFIFSMAQIHNLL